MTSEMIDGQRLDNDRSSQSTVYGIARTSGRDKASRIAAGHRCSNAEAITMAMQKLSDKLHRLERERDEAVHELAKENQRSTNGLVGKTAADAAQQDCKSIEDKLLSILRTCNDVISLSDVEQAHRNTLTTIGRRAATEPAPPSHASTVLKIDSHRPLAHLQMLIRILKMGRPQLDAEAHCFDVTNHILNIVQHYLRDAITVLRDSVAHLSVEWVQMSRTTKSTEDSAKIEFLKDRIRLVKQRRENLTLSVHRLEALKRKVVRLIRKNFDKLAVAVRPTKDKFLKSARSNTDMGRSKGHNHHHQFLKYNRGLELLKCIQQLHVILSKFDET